MTYIISELCGQWGGSTRRAEQMILQSKLAGADAVKVQLYDTYRMSGDNRQRWEYLSMVKDDFFRLKEYSDKLNIDFFASVFHDDRIDWLKEADLKVNKVASSLLFEQKELADKMIDDKHFSKNYISLGKWTENHLPYDHDNGRNIFMHCVSVYPHDYDFALVRMPHRFAEDGIHGYSDHTIGIEACKEAVRRGAKYIEKHYTIDKELQSPTEAAHICSMDFKELEELRNFCEKQ